MTEEVPAHRPVCPPSLWVDLDGPVHYVDHGGPPEGPLMVCVHGLRGSLLNWAAVAPHWPRPADYSPWTWPGSAGLAATADPHRCATTSSFSTGS